MSHNHSFKLIKRVKHVAEKRIDNLKKHYSNTELVSLLNGSEEDAIVKIANAIEPRSKNIARSLAVDIVGEWKANLHNEYAVFDYLYNSGVNDMNDLILSTKIARIYGEKSKSIISSNPYLLVRFFGWRQVDRWGKDICGDESDNRLLGAVDVTIKNELSNGHTKCHLNDFRSKIRRLVPNVNQAVDLAVQTYRILMDDENVFFYGANTMEKMIASRIKVMSGSHSLLSEQQVNELLDEYSSMASFSLSTQQHEAVAKAASKQFHVVSGYAGTGKSTALKALIHILKGTDKHIEMCALSGKAALRMAQASSVHAKTIYRFLRQVKESEKLVQSNQPIPKELSRTDNNTVVIIDEASMVDLGNMAQIFQSLKENTQLILLGDDFQLPPISFGLVFHELVKTPAITSKLSQVFRQASGNNIPVIGEEIRKGGHPLLPVFTSAEPGIQFLEMNEINPARIMDIAEALGGFDTRASNLQLVAATNNTVGEINGFMHKVYGTNKNPKNKLEGVFGNSFYAGDPVVFTRNDYKRNLFNGEIGHVVKTKEYDTGAKALTCVFNDEEHEFVGATEISDIRLAYALTCHKLQGSQFRRVIVVLENSQLCDPTWLYTAITRSTEQTIIIGSQKNYKNVFERTASFQKRVIGLPEAIEATNKPFYGA